MINTTAQHALNAICERIIAQFEKSPTADPIDFARESLDKVEPPARSALLTELARIELERNFASEYLHDTAWKPSRFLSEFEPLFRHGQERGELAFEHYRLARLYGRPVTREQIASLYNVSFDRWKELPAGSPAEHAPSAQRVFPRVGATFAGYPLIAELGRGALARVYLARQTDLASRLVVLKITGRLNAEADKLARLQHTNIIPVYSVHRSPADDLYAICMPYLGSLTLADLLILFEGNGDSDNRIEELISTLVARRRSTLINSANATAEPTSSAPASADQFKNESSSTANQGESTSTVAPSTVAPSMEVAAASQNSRLDRQLGYDELMGALHSLVKRPGDIHSACQIIEGIASAIAYAHSIGIVHRDLKPENVLIANDGRPVVLDFNLSDEPTGQQAELIGGTLPYMSLQQLQSLDRDQRSSPANDVFAIGTIFYRLLTGRLPYPSRSLDHLNQLIEDRRVAPIPVEKLSPKVPASLSAIVMRCLASEEKQRYPSAKELQEDLVCYRELRTLRYAPDRSLVERFQRVARRHPVLTSTGFLSALAAALLLCVGLAWWWSNKNAQRLTRQLEYRQMLGAMPGLLSQLHGPYRESTRLQQGILQTTRLLADWHIGPSNHGFNGKLEELDPQQQLAAREQLGQLALATASAEFNLAVMAQEPKNHQQHEQAAIEWNETCARVAPSLAPACRFQRLQMDQSATGLDGKNISLKELEQESARSTPLARLLLARQSGDLTGWLHWAEVMTEEQPQDALAWFNFGSAQYSCGRWERARSCFDIAAKLQSDSFNSIFWRGICLYQLGEHAQAIQDFDQCLATDSRWIAARQNRALAEWAAHRVEAAQNDATFLIDNQLAGPRVWLLRAQINASLGNKESAWSDRQSALSAKCFSADDWVAVGVQKIASEPQAALNSFETALKLEPDNVAALLNSAHVYSESLKEPGQAIRYLDRLIALRPTEASHIATRGILHGRMQVEAAALEDASRASELNPKAIELLQLAGIHSLLSSQSSQKAERVKQSIHWLRRSLLEQPTLVRLVEQDPDLAAIRDSAEYRDLVTSAKGLQLR